MVCICGLAHAGSPDCVTVPLRPEEWRFEFTEPERMCVGISFAGSAHRQDRFRAFVVPTRQDLLTGRVYCLALREIPNHSGIQVGATLTIVPSAARVRGFLDHNSVPIAVGEEDIEKILHGVVVTKVIYIPSPEFKELAWPVETILSYLLDPGGDPIAEARRRGDIVAILCLDQVQRLGGSGGGCRRRWCCRFARCRLRNEPQSAQWTSDVWHARRPNRRTSTCTGAAIRFWKMKGVTVAAR